MIYLTGISYSSNALDVECAASLTKVCRILTKTGVWMSNVNPLCALNGLHQTSGHGGESPHSLLYSSDSSERRCPWCLFSAQKTKNRWSSVSVKQQRTTPHTYSCEENISPHAFIFLPTKKATRGTETETFFGSAEWNNEWTTVRKRTPRRSIDREKDLTCFIRPHNDTQILANALQILTTIDALFRMVVLTYTLLLFSK